MSDQDAAHALVSGAGETGPEADGKASVTPLPEQPPLTKFRWLATSTMTIEHWLAGQARGDIEVFPGRIYRFREMTNAEMRTRDRFINTLAPEFSMRESGGKAGDRVNMPQWGRLKNIGTLVMSIESMNERPWPDGKTFEDKFRVIEGLGWMLTDRLVDAYQEFEEQLMWVVRGADLPNS